MSISQTVRVGLGFSLISTISGSLAALLIATGCTTAPPEIVERAVETKRVVTVLVPVPQTVEKAVTVEVPFPQTVIVEREVTKEVSVPETVIVEREVTVPETVIVEREVVVEVLVPETVIVEREIVVEVPAPETVVVEREVVIEVPVPETVIVERVVEVPVPQEGDGGSNGESVVVATVEVTVEPPRRDPTETVSDTVYEDDDFPRNRTLVVTHWSDSFRSEHEDISNFNWWLPGNSHARHAGEKGLIEHLFLHEPERWSDNPLAWRVVRVQRFV